MPNLPAVCEVVLSQLYSERQAAAVLCVPFESLRKWRFDGTGPRFSRAGLSGPVVYLGQDLLNFLQRAAKPATELAGDSRPLAVRYQEIRERNGSVWSTKRR